MKHDVSVIVVNWNGGADTVACLQSLHCATAGPARVVVVDNASVDDSLSLIGKWVAATGVSFCEQLLGDAPDATPAWLTLIRSTTNLGFAGANNVAIADLARSGADSDVLLLNNDATVAPDFFTEIGKARESVPAPSIFGATIYRMSDPREVWFAGGRAIPLRALVAHDLVKPEDPAPRSTAFVTGCTMMITAEALKRTGFLPECYDPGYMEDAEYCWRAREKGVGVYYAPRAVAYHRVGASFERIPAPSVTYTKNRNRVFFVRRNLRGAQRVGAMVYLAITKPARALVELIVGRPAQAGAVFRGAWDGFMSERAREG